jgi:RNA polymerase sigma-70 factor, ECF subfamily
MDRNLVIRAQSGDQEAFASVVLTLGGQLHALAHRVLRDMDLAEDATQAALVSIWRDLPRLRDVDKFESWCYRLVVNACYAEGRRQRRSERNVRAAPMDDEVEQDMSGLIVNRDELERGFRRLSMEHRVVLMLHYFVDMPLDQIAETVGIPPGTVRSRLHHAVRSMRAALEADARPIAGNVTR